MTEVESGVAGKTHNSDEVDDSVGFLGDQQLHHSREPELASQVEWRPLVCLRVGACVGGSNVCE